jgi:hypothetical protein
MSWRVSIARSRDRGFSLEPGTQDRLQPIEPRLNVERLLVCEVEQRVRARIFIGLQDAEPPFRWDPAE